MSDITFCCVINLKDIYNLLLCLSGEEFTQIVDDTFTNMCFNNFFILFLEKT